jgi:uncharacterized protein YndB with AHSA1/START domain
MIGRNNLTTATSADVELKMVMTRFFDASPKLVFKAYTDPNLIPKWWGSKRAYDYHCCQDGSKTRRNLAIRPERLRRQ